MSIPRPDPVAAVRDRRPTVARTQLRYVLTAWGVGMAGEWAFLVALAVTAFDRGGVAAVGIVGAARVLPGAVASPVVSDLLDRFPRARVLVGVEVSWAALVAVVPLALLAGSLLPLYAVVIASSVVAAAFRPTVSALIPQVVDGPDELVAANSRYTTLEAVGTLVGPLIGAALLATLPLSTVYLVTAALVLFPAAFVAQIATVAKPATRGAERPLRRLLEPLAGFPALVRGAPARAVGAVFLAQCVLRGLSTVYVVVAAISVLGMGRAGAGPLFAALGAGGLMGSAVAAWAASRRRLAVPFAGGMVLWGAPLVVVAVWPHPAVMAVALVVIGLGNAVADVNGLTVFQRLVPDHLLGRAFGAFWGCAAAGVAFGSVIAAPLIERVGLLPAMAGSGTVMALLPLVLWPFLRKVDAQVGVDPGRLAVLRGVPLFAPLTGFALEHLARRAALVTARPGDTVVGQGEPGDRFHVVEAGELSVRVDGSELRRLRAGDCFGEISLLRRVPRTATVVAVHPSRMLAVDGPTFVAAVTGDARGERAAFALVAERLARGFARPAPPR